MAEEIIRIPGENGSSHYETHDEFSKTEERVPTVIIEAVLKIERWWIRVKYTKIFGILKEAICAAEYSLTHEVLRKLNPAEARLLKDPALKAKIKFRFGGSQFPPLILFKIYTQSANGGTCYFSGKRMIKPASEAAEDARRQMGNRVFYDQMLHDACHHHQLKVTDEMDVTTMKEYMQYAANLDETPAGLGGKDNTWRRLDMTALPRHSVLANLVEFLEQPSKTRNSIQKLQSITRPPSQDQQVRLIKTVSSMSTRKQTPLSMAGRRSKQAKDRALKMRNLYSASPGKTEDFEDWDETVDDLYQWTQDLSFEDIT